MAEVARAVGMDARIGPQFLRAGVGFGGSCFRKDILNLAYLCEHHGLPEAAAYWQQVVELNEYQKRRFVRNMVRTMFNTLAGKRVAVWGFAFKPGTSDTRDSPAITICRLLAEERASVVISDPQALANARADMAGVEGVTFSEDPCEAARGAHAVALLTGWPVYAEMDFARVLKGMERPAFLFDGCNLLDHARLAGMGFHVHRVGAPSLGPDA